MTTLRVTTASGSVYLIDKEEQTAERLPGNDAGALSGDGRPVRYHEIGGIYVGSPFQYTWTLGDQLKLRSTTPVTKIEEVP